MSGWAKNWSLKTACRPLKVKAQVGQKRFLKTAWQRRRAPVKAQVGKNCSLKTAWRRRWAPVKAQVGKNCSLKTAWRRRWAPVKAQVGQKLLPKDCLPAAAAAQRSPRSADNLSLKHLSARPGPPNLSKKKGAPSARHYTPFLFEYLPLFSARVARSKAIVFQKSRLPRSPFFGGGPFLVFGLLNLEDGSRSD